MPEESPNPAHRYGAIVKVVAADEVENACNFGYRLVDHYEVEEPTTYSEASMINGFQYHEGKVAIVKSRRFIMSKDGDEALASANEEVHNLRAIIDRQNQRARSDKDDLSEQTKRLASTEACLKEAQAQVKEYRELHLKDNERVNLMETDLAKLRSELGGQRFREIVGK